jgi:hypothetical protein
MPANSQNPGLQNNGTKDPGRISFSNAQYGNNGINGQKFALPGWENGTVGFSGNIYSRLAAQNGIQPVDPVILAAREPFRTGRFLVKVLKTPPFFDPIAERILRYVFEDTVKDVSGLTEYAVETFKISNGVIRQDTPYIGIYKENNGDYGLRVPETAGQLVRKILDYWFYGISDPKTGVCHFYGKNLRAVQPNKSMSIIYILMGPTCRPEDIEFSCMWHEGVPGAPKIGHNNSTIGEVGSGVEHDVAFSGLYDHNPVIDALARKIVLAYNLFSERFSNAVVPEYIYTQYFGGDNGAGQLTGPALGIDLANRFAHELTGATQTGGALGDKMDLAYSNENTGGIGANMAAQQAKLAAQFGTMQSWDESNGAPTAKVVHAPATAGGVVTEAST